MAHENQILDPNTRNDLWMMGINAIPDNIFIGQGLFGDRVVTFNTGATKYPYMYVHNLFIELVVQFGLIFGLVLIAAIVYVFFKSLFLSKDSIERSLSMLFLPIGLANLMISFSYTMHRSFWLVLAIAVGVAFSKKKGEKHSGNVVEL